MIFLWMPDTKSQDNDTHFRLKRAETQKKYKVNQNDFDLKMICRHVEVKSSLKAYYFQQPKAKPKRKKNQRLLVNCDYRNSLKDKRASS